MFHHEYFIASSNASFRFADSAGLDEKWDGAVYTITSGEANAVTRTHA